MKDTLFMFVIILCSVFYFLWQRAEDKKDDIIFANTPLPQGVQAQIDSKPDKVSIKVSSGTGTAVQTIPNYPESHVLVNILDNGGYEIKQRVWGICLKPAFALGYDENINLGISARFFFWRDFGAFGGVIYGLQDKGLNIIAGADYRLRILTMPNLSFFIGYSSKQRLVFGFNFYLK